MCVNTDDVIIPELANQIHPSGVEITCCPHPLGMRLHVCCQMCVYSQLAWHINLDSTIVTMKNITSICIFNVHAGNDHGGQGVYTSRCIHVKVYTRQGGGHSVHLFLVCSELQVSEQ